MPNLWSSTDTKQWRDALARYEDVVAAQGKPKLVELDAWYRDELPGLIAARRKPHVTHRELVQVTEWKMLRGVWRARNLALVKGNDADEVERASTEALAAVPDPRAPIARLAELAGVGPATASAIAAAAAPGVYPFFDELVGAQVPGLGKLGFTPAYYAKYADALRARAAALGPTWTPAMVERALWSNSGGKVK